MQPRRRAAQGATFTANLRHVAARSLRMILRGQMLWCIYAGRWKLDPIETLTQLALSYFTCFLILQLRFRWQAVTAALLLAVNWGLYALFSGADGPFSPTANIGLRLDRALLGLDHTYDCSTINFLGSSVTVLFGAWTGRLLRSSLQSEKKLWVLATATASALAVGLALTPVNPVIHKCWTASFTCLHSGFTLFMTLAFYWMFDVRGLHKLAFPLVVVGMSSIFIYLINQTLKGWLNKTLGIFTAPVFQHLGSWGAVAQAWAVFLLMWLMCYWLYRRRIFFKV